MNEKIAKLASDVGNFDSTSGCIHPIDALLVGLECEIDIVSDCPGGMVFTYAGQTLAYAYDGTLEAQDSGTGQWQTLVSPANEVA